MWIWICTSNQVISSVSARRTPAGVLGWCQVLPYKKNYSGIGILGIEGTCVLMGAIPFSERTEYHSVHSAPDSTMNRSEYGSMEIDRIRVLLGNFWGEILPGRPRVCRHSSSQVTSAIGIPFSEKAFFSKLKFRVFCYS